MIWLYYDVQDKEYHLMRKRCLRVGWMLLAINEDLGTILQLIADHRPAE